jgi:hypothetical protein
MSVHDSLKHEFSYHKCLNFEFQPHSIHYKDPLFRGRSLFIVRNLLNQYRILDVYLVKEERKLRIPKVKLKECAKYCRGAGKWKHTYG